MQLVSRLHVSGVNAALLSYLLFILLYFSVNGFPAIIGKALLVSISVAVLRRARLVMDG